MTDLLHFNGVHARTGRYATEPRSAQDLAKLARGAAFPADHLAELKARAHDINEAHFAPIEGVDPKELAEAGWGVIFAFNADPALREALAPLLDLRKEQASRSKASRYREFVKGAGYRSPKETKQEFLDRHGAGGGGAVDPDQIPYYLLLVGDPEAIPFWFQYQMDVQYAVGRICFDTVEEYACYARSVVAAERGAYRLSRKAAFVGVANPGDPATQMSASQLVAPLAADTKTRHTAWAIDPVLPEAATKANLSRILHQGDPPALLFTASHGLCLDNGDERQFADQGALVCQDWPGPPWQEPIPASFYLGAEDIAEDAQVGGMLVMPFACYGGGTPALDDFTAEGVKQQAVLAPRSFVARLPQRLLAHPKGGALAVIAHVDRAWSYSFTDSRGAGQLRVFQSMLTRLMDGHPVGSALEYFNNRYSELASDLAGVLRSVRFGRAADPLELTALWACTHDARNFMVLGDPAVRLAPLYAPGEPVAAAAESLVIRTSPTLCEVRTYTAADPVSVLDNLADAELQAVTRIAADGSITTVVREGAGDEAALRLHADLVGRARRTD